MLGGRPPGRLDRPGGHRAQPLGTRGTVQYGAGMEVQPAGRRAMARAIGALIAGGAAVVLVWLALPHSDGVRAAPVIGLVLATWVLAGLLLAGRFDRSSRRALLGVEGIAAVLISATLLALDDPTSSQPRRGGAEAKAYGARQA